MSLIYGAGIAGWDEHADLGSRFGERCANIVPQCQLGECDGDLGTAESPTARLYVAESCGPCSEIRRWLEARRPVAWLILAPKITLHAILSAITYDPAMATSAKRE